MNQRDVSLRSDTLDCIIDKISRGPVLAERCFTNWAFSTSQDRIPSAASLFPGFQCLIPRDRDMKTELKNVTSYVIARDEDGDQILDRLRRPVFVPKHPDMVDHCEDDERLHFNFTTKVRNRAMSEWVKAVYPYANHNFHQPAVVITAKSRVESRDIFQAGAYGCNELLKEFQRLHPVDRLYTFVWSSYFYSYGILDIFGFVWIDNNKITPESFAKYNLQVKHMKDRLGDDFPAESYALVPQSLEALQELYDWRTPVCQSITSRKPDPHMMVVGVYFARPDVDTWKILPIGGLVAGIRSRYDFVQGFMRIHVGDEFLSWTPKTVEEIYSGSIIEIGKSQRHRFRGEVFQRNLVLHAAEVKATTWEDCDAWRMLETEDTYVVHLELPDFKGRVEAASEPVQLFGLLDPCLDSLLIYEKAEPVEGECSLRIVFPSADVTQGSWEYIDKQVIITVPKKKPAQVRVRLGKKQKVDA